MIRDLKNDVVGRKYLRMNNSFQDSIIYTVKLPVSEHKHPEFLEAKLKEMKNLEDYEFLRRYLIMARKL